MVKYTSQVHIHCRTIFKAKIHRRSFFSRKQQRGKGVHMMYAGETVMLRESTTKFFVLAPAGCAGSRHVSRKRCWTLSGIESTMLLKEKAHVGTF